MLRPCINVAAPRWTCFLFQLQLQLHDHADVANNGCHSPTINQGAWIAPKPIVTVCSGATRGGGKRLLSLSTVVIATGDAVSRRPGEAACRASSVAARRRTDKAQCERLMLLGDVFEADEAVRLGFAGVGRVAELDKTIKASRHHCAIACTEQDGAIAFILRANQPRGTSRHAARHRDRSGSFSRPQLQVRWAHLQDLHVPSQSGPVPTARARSRWVAASTHPKSSCGHELAGHSRLCCPPPPRASPPPPPPTPAAPSKHGPCPAQATRCAAASCAASDSGGGR